MPIIFGLVQNNSIVTVPGTIDTWGGIIAPIGWLLCDGSLISQSTYSALFSSIGGSFGISGGFFNIPDFRGRFLRGVSGVSPNDPNKTTRTAMNIGGNVGNLIGSIQSNSTAVNGLTISDAGHFHYISNTSQTQLGSGKITCGSDGPEGANPYTDTTSSNVSLGTGDSETRPLNAYIQFIIKY
jgi:microcystin-dependent protein